MNDYSIEQKQIIDWFNNTYSKRGNLYLRPKRAYYIYLELLKTKPNESILDIACGLGRLLEASQEYKLKPFGIDISTVAIEKTKQKFPHFNVTVANAESLPFNNNSFNYLTCIGSLERMIDKKKVLSEFIRVGKEDCKYCFLVRNSKSSKWQFFKKFLGLKNTNGHQDAKDYNEWVSLFESSGFSISEVYPDQYPLMKRKALSLKKVNYKEVIKSKSSIEKANEFLFILEKK